MLSSFLGLTLAISSAFSGNISGVYSTWVNDGDSARDGYEELVMDLKFQADAPLPAEYLDSIGQENIALRGFLTFIVDGFKMGPYPFASSMISSESMTEVLDTYYFYTYDDSVSFQYENFKLIQQEENLVLIDNVECGAERCDLKYLFTELLD